MPTLNVLASLDVDGVAIPALAIARRYAPTEAQSGTIVRATGGGAVALPTTDLANISFLFLTADRAITVTFGTETVPLAANSALMLLNATGLSSVSITNASGADATIAYLAAG